MSRLSLLVSRPRRTLAVLAAALAAVAVAVGSGATFSTQSTNPGNVFTTGTLKQTNSRSATYVATGANIKPGYSDNGTVTLTNTGNLPSRFTFTNTIASNTAGTNCPAATGGGTVTCVPLGDGDSTKGLQVKVEDTTGNPGSPPVVYDGLLKNLTGSGFNDSGQSYFAVAAGSSKSYKFTFSLPSTSGNEYQGGSIQADFTWDQTQDG